MQNYELPNTVRLSEDSENYGYLPELETALPQTNGEEELNVLPAVTSNNASTKQAPDYWGTFKSGFQENVSTSYRIAKLGKQKIFDDKETQSLARQEREEELKRLNEVRATLDYESHPVKSFLSEYGGNFAGAMADPGTLLAGGILSKLALKGTVAAANYFGTQKIASWLVQSTVVGGTWGGTSGSLDYTEKKLEDRPAEFTDILANTALGAASGPVVTLLGKGAKALWGRAFSKQSHDFHIAKAMSDIETGHKVEVEPFVKASLAKELSLNATPEELQVLKSKAQQSGEPQALDTLIALSEHQSEQVTKDEVLNAFTPQKIFEFEKIPLGSYELSGKAKAQSLAAAKEKFEIALMPESVNKTQDPAVLEAIQKEYDAAVAKTTDHYAPENISLRHIENYMKEDKTSTLSEALGAFLGGNTKREINSRNSVALHIKTRVANAYASLYHKLKDNEVLDLFNSRDPILAKEIEEGLYDGVSKNPIVNKIVDAISSTHKETKEAFKLLGREIPEIRVHNYIARMSANPEKLLHTHENVWDRIKFRIKNRNDRKIIEQEAYNRWRINQLKHLDMYETFGKLSKEEIEVSIKEKYAEEVTSQYAYGKKGFGEGISWEKSRLFIYKKGSFGEISRLYGAGDLYSSILKTVETSAKNIGMIEKLGKNPKETFAKISAALVKKAGIDRKEAKRISNKELLFNHIIGDIPHYAGQNLFSNILAYQYISKAGNVLLSSIFPDMAHMISGQQKMLGKSALNAMLHTYIKQPAEFIKTLGKAVGRKVSRNDLDLISDWSNHIVGDHLSRYSVDSFSGGAELANKFFGIHYWDESSVRRCAIDTARSLYQGSKKGGFDKINKDLHVSLEQYGIDAKMWDLIRENPFTAANKKKYFTVDQTFNYTKESIAKYLGKEVAALTEKEIEAVREEARYKLLSFNQDMADMTRIMPDVVERTQMASLVGSKGFSNLFKQFKGYPYAIARRLINGMLMENTREGFRNSSGLLNTFGKTTVGFMKDSPYILTWLTNLVPMYYLSMTAKDLVAGKAPKDPSDPDTWVQTILHSGFWGIYSDLMEKTLGSAYKGKNITFNAMSAFVGPAMSDIGYLGSSIGNTIFGNEEETAGRDMHRVIRGNLPINTFYTKLALNYLFMWRLHELLAPRDFHKMVRDYEFWKEPENYFLSD
ncbi:hypothetical protein GAMM_260010 [Gammaproteobacteria bacterium]